MDIKTGLNQFQDLTILLCLSQNKKTAPQEQRDMTQSEKQGKALLSNDP